MGADRWVKSTGGLLVPNRQIAPFKFGLNGCCCDDDDPPPQPCQECFGDEFIESVGIVIGGGLGNENCSSCPDVAGAYELGLLVPSNPCLWGYAESPFCGDLQPPPDRVDSFTISASVFNPFQGTCTIIASVGITVEVESTAVLQDVFSFLRTFPTVDIPRGVPLALPLISESHTNPRACSGVVTATVTL